MLCYSVMLNIAFSIIHLEGAAEKVLDEGSMMLGAIDNIIFIY